MTLRTYCLRGDKVLNVPSLFSRVDTAVQSIILPYQALGGAVTSLQVLLARKTDFMQ